MAVDYENLRLCKEIILEAKKVTKLGGGHYRFITFGEGNNDEYGNLSGSTFVDGGRLDNPGHRADG